jgi:hypothetical protein
MLNWKKYRDMLRARFVRYVRENYSRYKVEMRVVSLYQSLTTDQRKRLRRWLSHKPELLKVLNRTVGK